MLLLYKRGDVAITADKYLQTLLGRLSGFKTSTDVRHGTRSCEIRVGDLMEDCASRHGDATVQDDSTGQ